MYDTNVIFLILHHRFSIFSTSCSTNLALNCSSLIPLRSLLKGGKKNKEQPKPICSADPPSDMTLTTHPNTCDKHHPFQKVYQWLEVQSRCYLWDEPPGHHVLSLAPGNPAPHPVVNNNSQCESRQLLNPGTQSPPNQP